MEKKHNAPSLTAWCASLAKCVYEPQNCHCFLWFVRPKLFAGLHQITSLISWSPKGRSWLSFNFDNVGLVQNASFWSVALLVDFQDYAFSLLPRILNYHTGFQCARKTASGTDVQEGHWFTESSHHSRLLSKLRQLISKAQILLVTLTHQQTFTESFDYSRYKSKLTFKSCHSQQLVYVRAPWKCEACMSATDLQKFDMLSRSKVWNGCRRVGSTNN
jgi:hypothetical protein